VEAYDLDAPPVVLAEVLARAALTDVGARADGFLTVPVLLVPLGRESERLRLGGAGAAPVLMCERLWLTEGVPPPQTLMASP